MFIKLKKLKNDSTYIAPEQRQKAIDDLILK